MLGGRLQCAYASQPATKEQPASKTGKQASEPATHDQTACVRPQCYLLTPLQTEHSKARRQASTMFIETGTGSHPHLALHVLCDDDKRPLRLHHLL
jgi:hypothetical protein